MAFSHSIFLVCVIHPIESTNVPEFLKDYAPENNTATAKPKAFSLIPVLYLPTPSTPPMNSTHKITIPEALELERYKTRRKVND